MIKRLLGRMFPYKVKFLLGRSTVNTVYTMRFNRYTRSFIDCKSPYGPWSFDSLRGEWVASTVDGPPYIGILLICQDGKVFNIPDETKWTPGLKDAIEDLTYAQAEVFFDMVNNL